MKAYMYHSWMLTVKLDHTERFKWKNAKGLPFFVNQIVLSRDWQERLKFSASGVAIKTDGAEGFINRDGPIPIESIPPKVLDLIRTEVEHHSCDVEVPEHAEVGRADG